MQFEHSLRKIRVNGFDMTYFEQGDGKPVVFVHGTVSDHRTWSPHLQTIGQSYRAIAPDLRYFGTSEWPDDGGHLSIQNHANDLAAFIRARADDAATLVGWSYGGAVSYVVAVQHPELVSAMFLFEPSLATFLTDPNDTQAATDDRAAMLEEGLAIAARGDLAAAVRAFVEGVNDQPGLWDRTPSGARTMFLDNARTIPLFAAMPPPPTITTDDLRALEIPVKIIIGGETRAFFKIIGRAAAQLLPSAELQIVERKIHLWPILEPNSFTRSLLNFVAKIDGGLI